MARFLRQGLVFLLVVAGLYGESMLVLCRVQPGGHPLLNRTGDYYQLKGGIAYAKFQEFDPAARHDVIVVGSSHAYRGYDPRVFAAHGLDMFNLGTSAQTPLNTYFVLKHYVRPGSCGLVILDVYEGALVNDGLESTSELVRNMSSTPAAMDMAAALKDLRALNMVTLRLFTANDLPAYVDSTYVAGGFAERTDSLDKALEHKAARGLDYPEDQLRYLTKCLALCKERGLPVVLVTHFAPPTKDHAVHERFVQVIDSLRAPFAVPYLDMAYGHNADAQDHFYDHNHLNLAGVHLFNEALIARMDRAGMLGQGRRP